MSGQTTTVACPNGHPSANRVICTVCGSQIAGTARPGIDTAPTTAIPIAPVFAPQAPRLPKAPNSPPSLLAPLLRSGEAGPEQPDFVDVTSHYDAGYDARGREHGRDLPDPRDIPAAPRSYDNHAPDPGLSLPGLREVRASASEVPGASGLGNNGYVNGSGNGNGMANGTTNGVHSLAAGPDAAASNGRHDVSEVRSSTSSPSSSSSVGGEGPSAASGSGPGSRSSSGSPEGDSSSTHAIAPIVVDDTCPHCSAEIDPLARFCEVCGYDPSTGSLPSANAPVIRPAPPVPALSLPPAPPLRLPPFDPEGDLEAELADEDELDFEDSQATNSTTPAWSQALAPQPRPAGTWTAVITADRNYYEGQGVEGVDFPLGVPSRTIELPEGPVAIGRHSRSRGTHPAIDLSGPPEDPAVSHTHASLLPSDSGWKLVDHGSTNGTYLNESGDPVPANQPLTVKPGDRIYVGCWTRITLALVPPS
jgi:hypothetical protein